MNQWYWSKSKPTHSFFSSSLLTYDLEKLLRLMLMRCDSVTAAAATSMSVCLPVRRSSYEWAAAVVRRRCTMLVLVNFCPVFHYKTGQKIFKTYTVHSLLCTPPRLSHNSLKQEVKADITSKFLLRWRRRPHWDTMGSNPFQNSP